MIQNFALNSDRTQLWQFFHKEIFMFGGILKYIFDHFRT